MSKKVIRVGTLKGVDLLMKRKGKAHKGDPMVSRGCGIHTPIEYKEKTKQKAKNDMRRYY